MANVYPSQDSFVRGEISPRLHARVGLDLYRTALKLCENFVTLPHGGIRKRAGTYFAGAVKSHAVRVRLIPFIFSRDQAYCLEFGNGYARVFAYGAPVMDGPNQVEFALPYTEAQLRTLQFAQSADVMWVVHPQHAPRKITRQSATQWTVQTHEFKDGPFGSQNIDEAKKLYASHETGTGRTITANFPLFDASMIGKLIRIDMESYIGIDPWTPQGRITPGATQTRYNGNVYTFPSIGTGYRYGNTPPTHLRGTEQDGPKTTDPNLEDIVGLDLTYAHSGFGVGRITAVTSSTVATVDIVSRFPKETVGSGNASFIWRTGAFGPGGYPDAVTFFEERLVFSKGVSVYCSQIGNFDSFRLGDEDDDGLEFQNAANEANDIQWALDTDGSLALGTAAGLRRLSGSGIDEALTPSSFKNRSPATAAAAEIQPVRSNYGFLYVERGLKGVAELVTDNNTFRTGDLGVISEHIPKQGIREIGYQQKPDPCMWSVLENGQLAGLTYQAEQEVRGWHRHIVGGKFSAGNAFVESVCVTPAQSGVDDVWLSVKRTIGGQTRRYIEVMQPPFEYADVGEAYMVDCGLSYSGDFVSSVSGLDHLEGEMVVALANGQIIRDLVVTEGAVALSVSASRVHVGLPYGAVAETLELDAGARDGSVIGRKKKLGRVILSFLETARVFVKSAAGGSLRLIQEATIKPKSPQEELFTGNRNVPVEDKWESQCRIRIEAPDPVPCTIRAITPGFESEGQ